MEWSEYFYLLGILCLFSAGYMGIVYLAARGFRKPPRHGDEPPPSHGVRKVDRYHDGYRFRD